jgi:hypothetical protein
MFLPVVFMFRHQQYVRRAQTGEHKRLHEAEQKRERIEQNLKRDHAVYMERGPDQQRRKHGRNDILRAYIAEKPECER